jgi:hypothetical protein
MKPSELLTLRVENAEMRKLIGELRTVGATAMLQANETKAWVIALLKHVGPQRIAMADYDSVGEGQKGTAFVVTPCDEDPSYVMLSVGDVDPPEKKALVS